MDYAQGTIIIITMNQEKNGVSSNLFMDGQISNGVDKELQVHTEHTCEKFPIGIRRSTSLPLTVHHQSTVPSHRENGVVEAIVAVEGHTLYS